MSPATTTEIDIDELDDLIERNLVLLGLDPDERSIIASVLMYAELRGKSQGLIKILEKTVLPSPDRTALKIEQKTPAVHLVHGNGNCGMVVVNRATDVTIDACRVTGLSMTGTCGTASSTGSIGYYATKIAAAGFVGIVMAGSPKVMAVSGSRQRALGTNPLAIAVPTGTEPLVLDMATSASTWFDIIRAQRLQEALPQDVALDKDGNSTVDPTQALEGVLQTFAGTKGSGLALMIELLTGPLMGASIVNDATDNRGNFLLAINPLILAENFVQQVDRILDVIRQGPLQTGVSELRLPGEYSRTLASSQCASGVIRVDRTVIDELKQNVGA